MLRFLIYFYAHMYDVCFYAYLHSRATSSELFLHSPGTQVLQDVFH